MQCSCIFYVWNKKKRDVFIIFEHPIQLLRFHQHHHFCSLPLLLHHPFIYAFVVCQVYCACNGPVEGVHFKRNEQSNVGKKVKFSITHLCYMKQLLGCVFLSLSLPFAVTVLVKMMIEYTAALYVLYNVAEENFYYSSCALIYIKKLTAGYKKTKKRCGWMGW